MTTGIKGLKQLRNNFTSFDTTKNDKDENKILNENKNENNEYNKSNKKNSKKVIGLDKPDSSKLFSRRQMNTNSNTYGGYNNMGFNKDSKIPLRPNHHDLYKNPYGINEDKKKQRTKTINDRPESPSTSQIV